MEDKKRLDIAFKTTLIRFFKNLLEKADKINETYEDMKRDQLEIIRDQQEIIRDQQEIKNTFSEIKNIIQSPKNRMEDCKNQVKDLEHKEPEDTPPQKQEDKRIQKVEDNVRNLWDNFKQTNIRIMGIPEERYRKNTGRNTDRKLPPPGERNRLLTSPGSPQNPKQKESKEDHTKTHHN